MILRPYLYFITMLKYRVRHTGFTAWYEPMGGCIYCFGTWVFIVLFIVYITTFTYEIPAFLGLLLGMGVNYVFIELINKLRFG
jgi:hypothetical protein